MTKNEFNRQDILSIKGVAIISIILHNLIHLVCPIQENEFQFNIKNSEMFLSHLFELHSDLWKDIFSFLGWYGVCIFLFLSGYGLVKKYENSTNYNDISFGSFFTSHAKKLFLLMLLPYIIYLLSHYIFGQAEIKISPIAILSQIFMISNFYSAFIHPGVYWFFGLMLQLYIIFYLFILKKSKKNILILIILQLSVVSFFYYILDQSSFFSQNPSLDYAFSTYNLLHNFIGWLLPFSFGIIYARQNLSITFNSNLKNLLLFIIFSTLLILSNLNFLSWLISTIFAIFAAIYFNALIKPIKFINNFFIYVGGISAFIFATHPLIRSIYFRMTSTIDIFPVILYFITCIIVAICYKMIHTKIFK